MAEKRSTGPNDRPRNETIAQSGEGLPDDSGGVPAKVNASDDKAARRASIGLGATRVKSSTPGESGRDREA